jgi:hypothetical protein
MAEGEWRGVMAVRAGRLLPRQDLNELDRPFDPVAQLLVPLHAFGLDRHPALHRSGCDVELDDVRFLQGRCGVISGPSRTINEVCQMPTHMLPWSRKPTPPNIFFPLYKLFLNGP